MWRLIWAFFSFDRTEVRNEGKLERERGCFLWIIIDIHSTENLQRYFSALVWLQLGEKTKTVRFFKKSRIDKNYSFIYIYIYAFSRRFYPKRLTVHSGYTYFYQYMCSLRIEPTTFALLIQCSTTEPQKLRNCWFKSTKNIFSSSNFM